MADCREFMALLEPGDNGLYERRFAGAMRPDDEGFLFRKLEEFVGKSLERCFGMKPKIQRTWLNEFRRERIGMHDDR